MLREEEAGRPPARGGISAGGHLDAEGSVSSIALRVGSSASRSRPSASSSFSNSSMSTRNSEGVLRSSGFSNNELSRNAKESDSDLLRRVGDQGRGSRTAPSLAKTYATDVCEADVSAVTIAAGVAEAAADDASDVPSADELTLSGDEFLTVSPLSRSNSLDNGRLSSDCRDKGSSRHLLTSSSSSSCSSYGSSRGSQSPSQSSSQKKASSSSGAASNSVASRLAMPDTDRSTAARNERNRNTNLAPNNSAARSNLCSDRNWRRGQGEEEEAAAGETDTPQPPFERLWKASASSFASALSGGLASAQSVGVEQPLRAAASASHDPLSADGATGDGATRSSRSSTAQSSFSTMSSISCTTCSTSGGTSSHAKGGGGFLPSSCCYSFASSSSSCGGFAADEEGEEEVAARPAVVAAYDALDIAAALCGEGQGNNGETAPGDRRRRPSRAQSSLDPPVLLAPHDGDDAYVFDETMDGQLFPEFLLSTSASEEQLLQPSSVRGGGGGFAAGVGRSGGSYAGGRDPLRERERREARERQTLLLARQIVGRFRAVHGTAAAADAVQLLQRYFHASRRHIRDTRSLERLAAACCYISARQKGVDSTSLFCLNDLAAELQPLTSANGRRSRGSAAALEEEQQQETPQLDLLETRRKGELSASPERERGRPGGGGEPQQQGAGEMQQQHVVDGRQRETLRQLAQRQEQQHEAAQWTVAAEERPRGTTQMGGSLPKCFPPSDGGSRLRTSVCSSDAEEQVGVGTSSLFFNGTPATFHGESGLSSAVTSAAESLFCPPSSSSLDRTAAAAGVGGGSPAAPEIAQQSSKSQQAAHARCRTLARWIARVCRRLQLQQLPKAEPDMLLRCNALLRRVRQLVEQRLEEQEERTEERRAALVVVQQELQQQLQDRPRGQPRQPPPRERWRKGLNEGPSPAEGADEETRHREWGGAGETGRPRGAARGSGFSQLDEGGGKKQSGDTRTSDEVDEDMDLLLLQSVLAEEGADVFAADRVLGNGRQPPAPPAPADVAAALFADGSRAAAGETGEEKQARRQEKETEGDCSRTGEREKDSVATDTKRRHSTVSSPQGEQQKSKRSREADKFHRLLCLEVSSEVRQRNSATHSSSSGSLQREREYGFSYSESREAVGGSSNGDEPTAGPSGDALAREKEGERQRAAAARAAPLLHGQRAGGAARAAADSSFPQAAFLSKKDSWGGAAAAATQEDCSSSARTYTTSESDALLRETAEEESAFAGQGKGNSRVARKDLPGSGVDNSSKRCEYPPPGSSISAAAAGSSVCWGEDRARAAGETAPATADAMHAAAAAAAVVSPAAAPLRSATASRAAAAASREGLERALAVSDGGRGAAGDDDDSALVTLLETLGKGLGGSRGARTAEEDARDSSGGEERDSHVKGPLKVTQESSRAAAAGAASGGPSPQYLQRVLQLHMKKSVWQQQCHVHALEKLKKDREKVFRGLVLMHRVLTAVYNRSLASAGGRTSSSGSGAANRTAAAAGGGSRSDEHGWSSGRSEDPLDGAWRARGRSDAVCMASLIILVFQWVQVVVPQRVVIDALHVDRKSVYTRRMEHMRILRALFRRLKKPEAVARVDDEEDLAARFCEVLDSPALSRQLLEVAEEGLCASELLLILRRDPLSSLYAAPQQQQQGQQRERGEPQQSAQRQPLDDQQQQQQRSWRQPHDVGGGHRRGSGVSADSAAFLAAAETRPRKESAASRAASFAAIARAAVAAVAGAAKDGACARRRSDGGDCLARGGESKSSASASGTTTQASHARDGVGGGDEFLAAKRARRDFCYEPRSSAASAATASTPEGLGAADGGKAAGTACRPCGRVDEEAEAAAAYRRAAAAGRAPLHRGEEERERRGTATTASSEGWALSRACCSAAGADAEEGHAGRRGHLGAQRGSVGSPSAARKTESRGETDTSLAAARYVGVRDGAEAAAYYGGAGGGAEGGGPAGGGGSGVGIPGTEGFAARGGGRRTKARSRGSHPHTLPSTEQLKLAKTAVLQSLPPAANVVSLQFERTQQRWVCKWLQSAGEGRTAGWKRRCFSVLKYGYDGAHQLAAAAATKLRDGRQRLQQLQQQQGKPVSNKCRRAAPPAAAAAAAPPPTPARAATS